MAESKPIFNQIFFHYRIQLILFSLFLLIPEVIIASQSGQEFSRQDSVKNLTPQHVSGSGFESIKDYIESHQEQPSEKIFLHLDRSSYTQGDTIWFKGYLWYGFDQVPDTVSGVMHVDLINEKDSVILRRRLIIRNGTSSGEFCLDSTLAAGNYTMVAYTRLMLNQICGSPFTQKIKIEPARENFQFECLPAIIKEAGNDSLRIKIRFFEIDKTGTLNKNNSHEIRYTIKIGNQFYTTDSVYGSNTKEYVVRCSTSNISRFDTLAEFGISIKDANLTYDKQFHFPLQDRIDLQFLPEGGTLVNGLESKVAFKSIGEDGLSREVEGEIKTMDDEVVTRFKTTSKGMGFFNLRPETDKRYFAHLWYNNRKYIIPLPVASNFGSTISVLYTGNSQYTFLLIKHTPS